MKKQIITIIILVFGLKIFAQNNNYYQYDNLNRLNKTTFYNGTTFDYSYDQLGNRISKIISGSLQQTVDLVVQNQSLGQTTFAVGATVSVNCRVANTGNGSAGGNYTRFYLSANQTYEQGTDVEIGSDYKTSVAPSGYNQISTTLTIPAGTAPGNWYILFFTDATSMVSESNENNNIAYIQVTVVNCQAMQISSSFTNATCGLNNGTAGISVSGGYAPYSYIWSSGQQSAGISGLAAGSYTVTVSDFYGCLQTSSVTVNATTTPVINTSSTQATCGTNNGTASATVSGGSAPYTYHWNTGQSTASISNLAAGTYSVTVTDASSCSVNSSVTVTTTGNLTASLLPTSPTCGDSNGVISVTVTGGTQPYTFLWNNGQMAQTAINLSAGSYSVTVTDSNNCSFVESINLSSVNNMSVTFASQNATCGNANGTATATGANGTAPYTYHWSNGQNTQTATGLAAGAYNITITDANNCSVVSYATINATQPPSVTISSTPTACNGSTGTATANVTNGTPSYSYLWSNGQTSQTATGLGAGSYSVTVTDSNGCNTISVVDVIYQNQGSSPIIPTTGLVAYYPFNGNANDSSGYGNDGVTYGPTLTSDRFGNANSAYSFDGVDDNIIVGNSATFPQNAISICYWINRNGNTPSSLENYISKETAFQSYFKNNLKFESGLWKGTPGVWSSYENKDPLQINSEWMFYSFTFDNASHLASIYINGILDTTYSESDPNAIVRTSGANMYIGRNGSANVYYIKGLLDDIRIFNRALNGSEILALFNENGWSSLNQGLVAHYPFNGNANDESGNGNNGTVNGATLTTDRFGNSNSAYYFNGNYAYINVPYNQALNPDTFSITCWVNYSENQPWPENGIVASAELGYKGWRLASYNNDLYFDVMTGSYFNMATTNPVINAGNWHFLCGIRNSQKQLLYLDGVLIAEINNNIYAKVVSAPLYIGRYGLSYFKGKIDDILMYNRPLSNNEILQLYQGSNTPSQVAVNLGHDTTICANQAIVLDAGAGFNSYIWSNNETSQTLDISGLNPGIHTYAVTVSACGTTASDTVNINISPLPAGGGNITGPASVCQGQSAVTYTVSAIADATSYIWTLPQGVTGTSSTDSITVNFGTSAVSGNIEVKGHNGCGDGPVSLLTVTVNSSPVAGAFSSQNATCGIANGTVTAFSTDGVAPYSYYWSNGQNTQTATGLAAGAYNITITDANNCSIVSQTTVNATQPPTVTISSTPTACNASTGTATANVSNGTPAYSYLWSNGQTTQTATGLGAGTYYVTLTDGSGCIQNNTIIIQYQTSPTFSNNLLPQNKIFYAAKPKGKNYYSIYSMNFDGTGRNTLFNDNYHRRGPKISSDRKKIYYTRRKLEQVQEGDSVWICRSNLDGSNEELLWFYQNYTNYSIDYEISLSPDNQKLLYKTINGQNRNGDIYELNLSTYVSTNLTNDDDWFEKCPTYSPSGNEIIFCQYGTTWYADPLYMYKINASGSNRRLFVPYITPGQYQFPHYSPNGKKILYEFENNWGPLHLFICDTNGSNNNQIVPSSGNSNMIWDASIGFSPNGNEVYMVRNNNTQLVIMDSLGNEINTVDTCGHNLFYELIWTKVNPDTNLVAYYPFNDNANDESGNGHDGTVINAVFSTYGHDGNSCYFDGNNDYITVPHSTDLNLQSSQTLSAWVNLNIPAGDDENWILKKASIGSAWPSWGLCVTNQYKLRFVGSNGGTWITCDDSISFPGNTWVNVVSTVEPYQSGVKIKLYVNGQLQAETNNSNILGTNTGNLLIGTYGGGTWGCPYGYFDDISIYNRTLSSDEVLLLYQGGGSVNTNITINIGNDTTICANQAIVLDAGTGFNSYIWSNNETSQTLDISGLNPGIHTYAVTVSACGTTASDTVNINISPLPAYGDSITGLTSVCQGQNAVTYTVPAIADATSYIWTLPLGATGTSSTDSITVNFGPSAVSGNIEVKGHNGCGDGPVSLLTVTVNSSPVAEAGTKQIYSGFPVQIGSPANGPGTISWLPAAGLNNASIAQPMASPSATTVYTITVDNNGCIATDTVTVILLGGYTISGKTQYMGKANAGNPIPNQPTYNPCIYNIDNVIVRLINQSSGLEIARDTSDELGSYQFAGVQNGSYLLSYDKYTSDTMQWGNDINVVDVSMLKYLIASDTILDPSRCFSSKYKKVANVDNNQYLNVVDVSRIKTKIASPYSDSKNFPKGNWASIDTLIILNGYDLNVNLKTICYGDYNASSTRYRDSLTNWNGTKSVSSNIIVPADELLTTSDPSYFEVPLRISSKMNEFSALGLELNYPEKQYKLVSVSLPKAIKKNGSLKINPGLEEIINSDDDLLVTDEDGIIRVVYATTSHFDVAAKDELIVLGFRALSNINPGTLDFDLSGTGVIANQYGQVNEDAWLMMPRIFVQGNNNNEGFKFTGYPNPFGGNATLTYDLPEDGTVKLNVYNAIGELVAVLVNESQFTGRHVVEFSGKDLPVGMYSFKLEFEGSGRSEHAVLKMIK